MIQKEGLKHIHSIRRWQYKFAFLFSKDLQKRQDLGTRKWDDEEATLRGTGAARELATRGEAESGRKKRERREARKRTTKKWAESERPAAPKAAGGERPTGRGRARGPAARPPLGAGGRARPAVPPGVTSGGRTGYIISKNHYHLTNNLLTYKLTPNSPPKYGLIYEILISTSPPTHI